MNVLIICEDFRKDQFVVKPVLEAMVGATGKANAKLRVCMDPVLGGVNEALKWARLKPILERYKGMTRMFILVVDRDGITTRRTALDGLERRAAEFLSGTGRVFLGVNAWQEVEVWALAGQDLPPEWAWGAIRSENHPKERFFEPWASRRGLLNTPGAGRKVMGEEARARYPRVRSRCREDVRALEDAIRDAGG